MACSGDRSTVGTETGGPLAQFSDQSNLLDELWASERTRLKSRQCLRNALQPLLGQTCPHVTPTHAYFHTHVHTHSKEGNSFWIKDALSRPAPPAVHTGHMLTAMVMAALPKPCVSCSHFTQEQLTPCLCSSCHLFRLMIDFLEISERPMSPPMTVHGMSQAVR